MFLDGRGVFRQFTADFKGSCNCIELLFHKPRILSYCKFWIYWLSVNTKFTICHIVNFAFKTHTIQKMEFPKAIFRPLKDGNENLIYCEAMSLLAKNQYSNPVALFPVIWHLQIYKWCSFYRGHCIKTTCKKCCKPVKKTVKGKRNNQNIWQIYIYITILINTMLRIWYYLLQM